jgi:two-component system, cell cycle sensor histidine kinase and response regulator CckA
MKTKADHNEKERPELRILMIEDVLEDSELAQNELRQNGIAFTARVVDTRESFVTALQEFSPDIVLADYSLPSFNGLAALAIVREQYPGLPFIFVTGAVGEELAIEFLKKGATDYVLKSKLGRLSPAVQRAIDERNDRRERARLEERLRQAQKMEAVGTLAGGIAHDFNNILAAIIGFTELTIDDVPEGSLIKRNMNNVLKAGIRGRDLVKQILTFSRKGDPKRAPLRLTPVVQETFKLLRATTPTSVAMELHTHATSGEVLADSTEISQLLMNLGANAAYAMRDNGGLLEITLSDIEFRSDSHPPHPDLAPGAYVELLVKDTGSGMDAATKNRIFEPFFTTKERGQGTGMGLAVVHGVVQSLGGAITVSSEPGRGSTFTVFLPKVAHEEEAQPEIAREVAGGKERILFVDDEEMLVEMAGEMLGRLGYEVVATTDAGEALRIFSGEPDRFHCVITDYTMPNVTGVELAKDLMKIRPDISIILCTGHSEMISQDKAHELGIREFAMKPLIKREIAETIRRVLDTKAQD